MQEQCKKEWTFRIYNCCSLFLSLFIQSNSLDNSDAKWVNVEINLEYRWMCQASWQKKINEFKNSREVSAIKLFVYYPAGTLQSEMLKRSKSRFLTVDLDIETNTIMVLSVVIWGKNDKPIPQARYQWRKLFNWSPKKPSIRWGTRHRPHLSRKIREFKFMDSQCCCWDRM